MKFAVKAATAVAAAALLATPILAQRAGGGRLAAPCREEIVRLCGTDRTQMRSCLAEKASELSDTCRTALMERMQAAGAGAGGREGRMGGRRGGGGGGGTGR